MNRALPILTVLAGIIVAWYAASVWMNSNRCVLVTTLSALPSRLMFTGLVLACSVSLSRTVITGTTISCGIALP